MKCPKCGGENCHNCVAQNVCLDCMSTWTNWQQAEIEHLRACLKKIGDHDHCDARTADINDLKIGYWATASESEKDFIIMGIAAGHRCCAAIAAEGLKGK